MYKGSFHLRRHYPDQVMGIISAPHKAEHPLQKHGAVPCNRGQSYAFLIEIVNFGFQVSLDRMDVKIEQSWKAALGGEFGKPYFAQLAAELHRQKREGAVIFPPGGQIFRAFELCPLDRLKVVILGQDPYHGYGQATGLSFSVPAGVPAPPSLKNVFKEIESDLGIRMSGSPDLTPWAEQGVLLLNAVLTVRAGEPASHSRIGWQEFTDAVIGTVSERLDGVVFMLWGNYARSKAALIDSGRHFILEAAHPSPLARGAFFGCRHFSKANSLLISEGRSPIDWKL